MQIEYATDLVFRRQAELEPIYEALIRTAVHAVKCENVAHLRAENSRTITRGRSATTFTPGSKERGSSTTWDRRRSRCMTSSLHLADRDDLQ